MYVPCMIQVLGRKRTLQAAQTHPKTHRVQVDLTIIRFISLPNLLKIGVLINHQWHSDVNGMLSSESNVFSQSGEAGMRSDMVIRDVSALCDGINELFLC